MCVVELGPTYKNVWQIAPTLRRRVAFSQKCSVLRLERHWRVPLRLFSHSFCESCASHSWQFLNARASCSGWASFGRASNVDWNVYLRGEKIVWKCFETLGRPAFTFLFNWPLCALRCGVVGGGGGRGGLWGCIRACIITCRPDWR